MKRQQLISLIQSLFEDYLEEKFYKHNKKVQDMLESGAFVDLNSKPQAKEINIYFADLMAKLARGVYEKMKEGIVAEAITELDTLLESLLDDEETEQVLTLMSSPLGRKLARNLDIFREVFAKQITALNIEVFKLWNEPGVTEQIDEFVRGITGEEE